MKASSLIALTLAISMSPLTSKAVDDHPNRITVGSYTGSQFDSQWCPIKLRVKNSGSSTRYEISFPHTYDADRFYRFRLPLKGRSLFPFDPSAPYGWERIAYFSEMATSSFENLSKGFPYYSLRVEHPRFYYKASYPDDHGKMVETIKLAVDHDKLYIPHKVICNFYRDSTQPSASEMEYIF